MTGDDEGVDEQEEMDLSKVERNELRKEVDAQDAQHEEGDARKEVEHDSVGEGAQGDVIDVDACKAVSGKGQDISGKKKAGKRQEALGSKLQTTLVRRDGNGVRKHMYISATGEKECTAAKQNRQVDKVGIRDCIQGGEGDNVGRGNDRDHGRKRKREEQVDVVVEEGNDFDRQDDEDFQPFHPLMPKRQKTEPISSKQESSEPLEDDEHDEDDVKVKKGLPKGKYNVLMREFPPHVEVAFNETTLARCTSIAVVQLFRKAMVDGIIPIECVSEIFRSILFVKKSNETLEEAWSSAVGKLASATRRRVMYCVLEMSRRNVFENFAENSSARGKPSLPLWLTKKVGKKKTNYLKVAHIESTVNKLEVRQVPRREFDRRNAVLSRGFPHPQDVGLYVFSDMYSRLKNMYTKTRLRAKQNFFESLGYLFVDWN